MEVGGGVIGLLELYSRVIGMLPTRESEAFREDKIVKYLRTIHPFHNSIATDKTRFYSKFFT